LLKVLLRIKEIGNQFSKTVPSEVSLFLGPTGKLFFGRLKKKVGPH
jgi:hypothetical protein